MTLTQGAVEAWSLGFEGEGIKVAVLDTGVDFGNPDLDGTQARVDDPLSPYYGWPIAFDSRSMRGYLSSGTGFPGSNTWFSDTSITDTDTDTDGYLDTSGYEIGNITSQSGVYHLGTHPDDYLRFRYGDYVGVLVTDTTIAGVYDAVYVDLDNDISFVDEKAAVKGDEVSSHDLDSDGLADRSGGLVYFIADGVTPIPYSDSIAADMGIANIIPTNGDLVTFALNDASESGGAHGTLCASAVAAQGVIASGAVKGMAPKAKIISVGNIYQGGNWWDNYIFAVEGYDGIPGTGDEANILSMSFGSSYSINKGWGQGERYVDYLTTYYAPTATFMAAAGNGGYGYGTIISPGSSPGVVTVGASTSTWTAEPANYTTWGDVISWSDRGPTALGQVDPDILSVGAYGSGDVTLNQVNDANSAWGIWGGTSMATPVAAGIMSLLYESYNEGHGQYPSSAVAREIIMSSADNINYDAVLQGAGIANASRAVQLANERYGVKASPSFWTAGGYRGTHYEAFGNILFPGDSDNKTFQVYNSDQLNSTQVSV
ncbi:MAG: S8 family serine peptidase, partial [Thermoplasmata archaeon]|nr:S8 family serine peptidase [Thermoplasmata archaeon]